MAKRDPHKRWRNQRIKAISESLETLLPRVLKETGLSSVASLHGKIGGKNAWYIDIKNAVIRTSEEFQGMWYSGLIKFLDSERLKPNRTVTASYWIAEHFQRSKYFRSYTEQFLERTYWREQDNLSKRRPTPSEAEVWIGLNDFDYGLLVSPRFVAGQWENDKSEIRRFGPDYFTIGHVLATGLVVPDSIECMDFNTVEQYLTFFKASLVRGTKSPYQKKLATLYCDHVMRQAEPERVPLLIPEWRYEGKERRHVHRLDFAVIDPFTFKKVGFELSPWSTHGEITGTKWRTQKDINAEQLANFEREMRKQKDYFRKFDITVMIYTNSDLSDLPARVFPDLQRLLTPQREQTQLKLVAEKELLGYRL